MASKSLTEQDEEATTVVIYTDEEINTFNHDVKLSVLSPGHLVSSNFATKEVKGVNYFPSRVYDLEIWKKDLKDKRLVNSVKYLQMVCSLFEQFENKCKNKYNLQIKLWKIQMRKTDFASYSLTQWQFWQLTLKWLSGARAQGKNKQYYYCFLFFLFLFNYAIQEKFTAWRVNSTLNFPWKTDITIIASRFVSKYIYIDIYRWEKLHEINQTIELLKWVWNEIAKTNFSNWDCEVV